MERAYSSKTFLLCSDDQCSYIYNPLCVYARVIYPHTLFFTRINILVISRKKKGDDLEVCYDGYTSCPIVKIALGSTYTLQDLTKSLPASVPRKLTIAFKSDTSILATYM